MAFLGFKNEKVAVAEVTKIGASVAAFGASMFGFDVGAAEAIWAAVGTQLVGTIVGFIPMKGKNPVNARESVYSEQSHEEIVDQNRREVRRENEFVEAPDDDFLFVGGAGENDTSFVMDVEVDEDQEYDQADDEFTSAFVGGGGF